MSIIIPLAVGFAISLVVSGMCLRKFPTSGSVPLFMIMMGVAVWIFGNIFEVLASALDAKMPWIVLEYLGIVFVPVGWFFFALEYTGRQKLMSGIRKFAFCVIPVFSLVLLMTNKSHGLFYKETDVVQIGNYMTFQAVYGLAYWIHVAYSYGLLLFGAILVFRFCLRLPKAYQVQAYLMLVAMAVPFIANIIFTFKVIRPPYDITPFGFLASGVLIFWSVFRHKLIDLVPIAHNLVIEHIQDRIMVLDHQKRVIYMNRSAMEAATQGESVIGKSVYDVLEQWPELVEKYHDVEYVNEEIMFKGSDRVYQLSITPLPGRSEGETGRIIVLHDITDLKRIMGELEQSKKMAESANIEKSRFLANVSHEIRTPMNGVLGMLDLALETPLNEQQKDFIVTAKYSAEDLLYVINDILDFSKIEAGKMKLEEIEIDIRLLVQKAVSIFKHKMLEKGIALVNVIDGAVPQVILGDPVRVRQILANLISNAVKFTEKGKIGLFINVLKSEGNRIVLRFQVTDTGIGIPAGKMDTLFKSFNQVDDSNTRKYGGTGLGLAISKQLVEMMNGEISVESHEGEGSVFTFYLPFKMPENALETKLQTAGLNGGKATQESQVQPPKELSVLLVDDNATNRKLVTMMLEKFQWNITTAEDGKKALEAAGNMHFDIILMDVQMPVMDGFEATTLIRKLEQQKGAARTPIIAMTAHTGEGDEDKCLSAGMDGYLSKPVKKEILYQTIMMYVKRNNRG